MEAVAEPTPESESDNRSEPPPEPLSPPEIIRITDLLNEVYSKPKQRRMHYTMKKKRHVLIATQGLSQREAAMSKKFPRWTLMSWRKNEDELFAFRGSEKTLWWAPGRREIIPFSAMLVTFMKEARRESLPFTSFIIATFIREEHSEWLEDLSKDNKDTYTAYQSLQRLLQRFAYRHGFVRRTPDGLKEKLEDLVEVQDYFAKLFKSKYNSYAASEVFNCNETGIYFDAPPGQILSERGQSSAITAQQKHSARLTAVCTIRADGVKLSLLFIGRGEQNGIIEREELPTYPDDQQSAKCIHCYVSIEEEDTMPSTFDSKSIEPSPNPPVGSWRGRDDVRDAPESTRPCNKEEAQSHVPVPTSSPRTTPVVRALWMPAASEIADRAVRVQHHR
ncbi:uncharacterized protein PITG_16284 [Phytophthora infestans T30-4]|uniref:DDE-1 domain-containing protein n=1 Tax=Phytophthora infestans (strain T30-4) TaxID=403677 RepID=D0NTJ1_PHYIT|nr:uncharacterized protein PITG_16284 [Phytophthora infestans T30-4]EEY64942.1 conserved hypothetical protein [Phytophthora infestans T30-4]|eukprot:XP_002897672.1 conserved hypothetical protein [Phytophthora infestans T30-4]